MGNAIILRGLTMPQPPDLAKITRQKRRTYLFFFLGVLAFSVPLLVLEIQQFFKGWETGDWGGQVDDFLLTVLAPAVSLAQPTVSLTSFTIRYLRSRDFLAQTFPLRQAALTGDDQIAPLAASQPAPLEGSALTVGLTSWGPYKRPPDSRREWAIALGILALLFAPILLTIPLSANDIPPGIRLILGIIAAGLVVLGLPLLLAGRRFSRDLLIQADEWQLVWRQPGWFGSRHMQMEWHAAQAFFTFTYEQRKDNAPIWKKYQVYVLEGPQVTLAWMVPAPQKPVSKADIERLLDARVHSPFMRKMAEKGLARLTLAAPADPHATEQDQFASLVASKTRLPLRDLTTATEQLVDDTDRSPADRVNRMLKAGLAEGTSLQPPQPRKKNRRYLWLLAFGALPLILAGILIGVGYGLQGVQVHRYQTLLAQIRAHQPLYRNPLNAPTGGWTASTIELGATARATYANNAYQLTGADEIVAWTTQTYGDALVEVTATLLNPGTYGSDLGLVLHANSLDDLLTFQISSDGFWEIGPGYFPSLDQKVVWQTDTINSAIGAANRLSVIMQGNRSICFVNDHFLGIYQDTSTRTGRVGVYLSEATSTAAFSDFVVYPL